jgi:hypothetical protein
MVRHQQEVGPLALLSGECLTGAISSVTLHGWAGGRIAATKHRDCVLRVSYPCSVPTISVACLARSTQSASNICSATLMAFRWNRRQSLGFDDFARAAALLKGAKGKRLTYRLTDKGTQSGQADA